MTQFALAADEVALIVMHGRYWRIAIKSIAQGVAYCVRHEDGKQSDWFETQQRAWEYIHTGEWTK